MKKLLFLVIGGVFCFAWFLRDRINIGDLANPTVQEVVHDPRSFTGREIAVAGVVGNNFAVMGLGYYELIGPDGSALTVLSNQGAPAQGKRITVRGRLHQAYALGSNQALVLVETPKPNNAKGNITQ
jgi:hypothetical protein